MFEESRQARLSPLNTFCVVCPEELVPAGRLSEMLSSAMQIEADLHQQREKKRKTPDSKYVFSPSLKDNESASSNGHRERDHLSGAAKATTSRGGP